MQCNVQCNCLIVLCVVIVMASYYYYFPLITFELSVRPSECGNDTAGRYRPEDGEESRDVATLIGRGDVVRTGVNGVDGFFVAVVKSDAESGFLYLYAMSACVFVLCNTLPEHCFRRRVDIDKCKRLTVEKECGCGVVYDAIEEP